MRGGTLDEMKIQHLKVKGVGRKEREQSKKNKQRRIKRNRPRRKSRRPSKTEGRERGKKEAKGKDGSND